MKFGQVIQDKRDISLQILRKKWVRETSSRPFLVFFSKKAVNEVKASVLQLSFNILR